MNKALLSSQKMDWGTPQDLFDELDDKFRFVIDLAASPENAKCERFFTESDDALSKSWVVGGWAFCNPPYGRQIRKWVEKAYHEWKLGAKIVMLIPARTDTSYFHDYIYGKAKVIFIRGRIRFVDPEKNVYAPAPFPSMIVIFE